MSNAGRRHDADCTNDIVAPDTRTPTSQRSDELLGAALVNP